jgi:hypothetical protein
VSQLSGPTFTANEREEIINAFALSEAAKKYYLCDTNASNFRQ